LNFLLCRLNFDFLRVHQFFIVPEAVTFSKI
jgi:hypothetical protein